MSHSYVILYAIFHLTGLLEEKKLTLKNRENRGKFVNSRSVILVITPEL